ncbi:phosphoinositide phosphatase sac9-related [Anaeramoeba flamelloides]|uniref:Phosphoinositide phosphatase sac9-related n=1 Tax=Anaeramoeba flamelloides TaxID=1746091 RepID=A0AAV8AFK2_9EUKA|nr:phosphoinositide phosphatase sac9-related [Anaeramoeba flamelloides]
MNKQTIKKTTHLIVQSQTDQFFIISSLCTREDTQIISIDPITGSLCYDGIFGYDLFQNESMAIRALNHRRIKTKSSIRCPALIGYCVMGSRSYLLLGTSVKETTILHGKNIISTITESRWIKIPLQYYSLPDKIEKERMENLLKLPIDDLHFYCDTMDITNPYPSTKSIEDYCPDYCWNEWLSEPFKILGMRKWCVVLLQGCALSRDILTVKIGKAINKTNRNQKIKICILTKKSNLNPGTKGNVGGLNKNCEPGNEIETELILSLYDKDDRSINWTSFVFRIGNIPLGWNYLKSNHKKKNIDSNNKEISFSKLPLQRAITYYQKLKNQTKSKIITCVSLSSNENEINKNLNEKYKNSHDVLRNYIDAELQFLDYDWDESLKNDTISKIIPKFWRIIRPFFFKFNLNQGIIKKTNRYKSEKRNNNNRYSRRKNEDEDEKENENENENEKFLEINTKNLKTRCIYSPNNNYYFLKKITNQNQLFRFSGSVMKEDFLKTNSAIHFFCQQIIGEMCRKLGVGLNDQYSEKNWVLFKLNFTDFSQSFDLRILQCLSELFLLNGEILKILYTNQIKNHHKGNKNNNNNNYYHNILENYNQTFSTEVFQTNYLNLRKKYSNICDDSLRNTMIQYFLGKNLNNYFPITLFNIQNNEIVSNFPSKCLRKIPCRKIILPSYQYKSKKQKKNGKAIKKLPNPQLLLNEPDIKWVVPSDESQVIVDIFLKKPSVVSEICLTVRHELGWGRYPIFFDLFVGDNVDELNTIYNQVRIPFCGDGTKLWYPLKRNRQNVINSFQSTKNIQTPKLSKIRKNSLRYNQISERSEEERKINSNNDNDSNNNNQNNNIKYEFYKNCETMSRIVRIVFYGKAHEKLEQYGEHLILGKIDVFGYRMKSDSPEKIRLKLITNQTQNKIQNIFNLTLPKEFYKTNSINNFWNWDHKVKSLHQSKIIMFNNNQNELKNKKKLSFKKKNVNNNLNEKDTTEDTQPKINNDDNENEINSKQEKNNNQENNNIIIIKEINKNGETLNGNGNGNGNGIKNGNNNENENEKENQKNENVIINSNEKEIENSNNKKNDDSSMNNINEDDNSNDKKINLNPRFLDFLKTYDDPLEAILKYPINYENKKFNCKQYYSFLERLMNLNSNKIKYITFLQSLQIELLRIQLQIDPFLRDHILINNKIDPTSINPEHFIYYRDKKVVSEIMKQDKYKTRYCSNKECKAKLTFTQRNKCSYCFKKYCLECLNSRPIEIIEFAWEETSIVCKKCAEKLLSQRNIINLLIELMKLNNGKEHIQKKLQIEEKNEKLLKLVSLSNSFADRHYQKITKKYNFDISQYPFSSIINSVQTDINSSHIQTVFFPQYLKPNYTWFAPQNIKRIEILLSLNFVYKIKNLTFIVDSLGYNKLDSPLITLLAGDYLPHFIPIKTWDLNLEYQKILKERKQIKLKQKQIESENKNKNENENEVNDDKIIEKYLEEEKNKFIKKKSNLIIPPCTAINLNFSKKINAKIISLLISLKQDENNEKKNVKNTSVLHLGRIMINGVQLPVSYLKNKIEFSNPNNQQNSKSLNKKYVYNVDNNHHHYNYNYSDNEHNHKNNDYDHKNSNKNNQKSNKKNIKKNKKQSEITKSLLWINKMNYDKKAQVLKLEMQNTIVSGISYTIMHNQKEGWISQPKMFSVVVIETSSIGKPIRHELYGIYLIPKVIHGTTLCFDFIKPIRTNKVIVELLSNYGGLTIVPGNVSLY